MQNGFGAAQKISRDSLALSIEEPLHPQSNEGRILADWFADHLSPSRSDLDHSVANHSGFDPSSLNPHVPRTKLKWTRVSRCWLDWAQFYS
jgi:hypothetical protein